MSLFSKFTAPPPYLVPGVEPAHARRGGREASYLGDQLVRQPPVAAALARSPQRFLAVADGDPEGYALPLEDACGFLEIGTGDGIEWEFALSDEIKSIVDTGCDLVDEDLLQQAIASQPDVVDVDHMDREVFVVKLARMLRADEVFARYLDAVTAAHRELARQRGITLPY